MYKKKLNKISNLIDSIKNDINMPAISNFLEWFYDMLKLNFKKDNIKFDIQKGDIFYVRLGMNIGSELNKVRPCIVYSKKFANKGNTVVVIPLRSYKGVLNKNLFVLLKGNLNNNLLLDSLVDFTGIRQVSKKRLKGYIGKIQNEELSILDNKFLKIYGIKK